MSQFRVYSKEKGQVIKVDKIDPSKHLHVSSFTEYSTSFADKGTRGEVPFSKEALKSIKEQYGPESVVSKAEAEEEAEEVTPKKKK